MKMKYDNIPPDRQFFEAGLSGQHEVELQKKSKTRFGITITQAEIVAAYLADQAVRADRKRKINEHTLQIPTKGDRAPETGNHSEARDRYRHAT